MRLNTTTGLIGLLYLSIVVIRFFTETVAVLPRLFEYSYDLLIPVGVLAVLLPKIRRNQPICLCGFGMFLGAFVSVWIFSSLLNRDVHLISSVAFLVMHLEGPLWFLILVNVPWGDENLKSTTRIFVTLASLQVAVCLIQIPYGIYVGNPDVISGTFGQNNSQLAFFVALFTFWLLAEYAFGAMRLRRLVWTLLGTVVVFFAAGFRSIWASYLLTAVFIVVISGRLSRRQITAVVAALLIFTTFAVASVGQALEHFADVFQIDLSQLGKVEAAAGVLSLYKQSSRSVVLGCGPGTFSSRAWRTFTRIGDSGAEDFSIYDDPNWGSGPSAGLARYRPGFYSAEYIIPIYQKPTALLGSTTIDGPFTSYVSLLAEVGVVGTCSLLGAYVFAVLSLWRVFRSHPDSPRPSMVALTAIGGFILLFQMSAIDNWFEVGRVTIPVWALAAATIGWHNASEQRLPDGEFSR